MVVVVGAAEAVHLRRDDSPDLVDGHGGPGGDGQVEGADAIASADGELVVEPGRVVEDGVVLHVQALGGAGHHRREVLPGPGHPLGDGDGGVVGRHHEQGVEGVVELPRLANLHVHVAGGHALGHGAHGHLGVGRQLLDRDQGGQDLAHARREHGLVLVARLDHRAGVVVHHDPGPGRRRRWGHGGGRRLRGPVASQTLGRRHRPEHAHEREEPEEETPHWG